MPIDYAKAIVRLKKRGELTDAKIAENLRLHLTRTGKLKLLPAIVRELKKLSYKKDELAVLEIASESERNQAMTAVTELGLEKHEVRVNASLISGWRVKSKGNLIDRSGKRFLIDLYRSVTN
jgi:F0F1-type ATP synthase delta subunit